MSEAEIPSPSDTAGRDSENSTRGKVLQVVVEQGPISAAAAAQSVGLTAAAVRRHLDAMTEEGLVEVHDAGPRKRTAGRPSRRYVISTAGQETLGDDYLTLARQALNLLSSHAVEHSGSPDGQGASAARLLAQQYFGAMEARYQNQLDHVTDLDERTQRLAELFHDDHFAGFTRLVGRKSPLLAMQSTQLCQGHCPIREIAQAHPVFCEEETEMIARLLEVDVRRLSTQAAGAHVCTTHVPVGREKLVAEQKARKQATSAAGRTGGRKRIVISQRQQERLS